MGPSAESVVNEKENTMLYVVIGTLDKADWDQYSQKTTYLEETHEKIYIFKDIKHFDIVQGGWVKDKG